MTGKAEVKTKSEVSEDHKLTHKQFRALACLLSCPTLGEAAQQAKISVRTLQTWLDDADFRAALYAADQATIDAATRRLIAWSPKALDTLQELMGTAHSDAVRRQAALDWLNLSFRFHELHNIEERLAELEKRTLNEGKKL